MTASWRTSAIADKHRVLGSTLDDWNGMGTAWDYNGDQKQEYLAIRHKAGLMDVSGLKKVHLVGPHAAHVIDEATTRNVAKITPGKSAYACMLNDGGKFIDDCIIYRISTNSWMVVHGSGTGHQQLQAQAQGKNLAILFDDDMHDLSLQGPVAVDFLEKYVEGIRKMPYFHHMQTTLFGAPVMISRTGYSGERGYEIFCRAQDTALIWDTILDKGKSMGIVHSRFTTLDWLRVESYLLFYPYDNSDMYSFDNEPPGDTLWELGLEFTVSPGKTNFRGASEHYRLEGKERFKIYGLKVDGNEPAGEGDTVRHNGKKIGITTCGMVNPESGQSMAIARLSVDTAVAGTQLTVEGTINATATAHPLPFYDVDKKRRTVKDE